MKHDKIDGWKHVINPEGTAATIRLQYQDTGDYGWGYEWAVIVTFADPALNPPLEEEWRWSDTIYPRDKTEDDIFAEAIKEGLRLYDWVMSLRTSYSLEETVNHWRKRYEGEHDEVIAKQRCIQDLTDKLRWREERIKELESDYIKQLEGELTSYRTVVRLARERALEDARLLTISD